MFENKEPKQKQTKVEIYLGGEQEQSSSSTGVVTQICGACKGLQTEVQNLYRLYPIVGNRLTHLNFRLVRSKRVTSGETFYG